MFKNQFEKKVLNVRLCMGNFSICVPYDTVINGVQVKVYDSPGLQDTTGADEEYLSQIESILKEVDIVLYCIEHTITRWLESDENTLKKITVKFGIDIWTKTIVVLTKGNHFQFGKPSELIKDREKWYKKCEVAFNDIETNVKTLLTRLLPKETAKICRIPFVAAGDTGDSPEDRILFIVIPEQKHKDYLATLFLTCIEMVPDDSTKAAAMHLMNNYAVTLSMNAGSDTDLIEKMRSVLNLQHQPPSDHR